MELADLPDIIFVRISSYLTGDRGQTYNVQFYKTDVTGLLSALPHLWTRLSEDWNFHRVVRGGIDETIESQLASSPISVPDKVFRCAYVTAQQVLALPDGHNL
jgi:hypothetical protein